MADLPILFNGAMVRALLDDRKGQTRRALRPQPDWLPEVRSTRNDNGPFFWPIGSLGQQCGRPVLAKEARYAVGDRLWVREAYYQRGHWEPVLGAHTKGNRQKWAFVPTGPVSFDAPAEYRKGRHHEDPATVAWHKRLGRFMPRAYSRLTLTVTDVRVERLQDISEADAIAEGIYRLDPTPDDIADGCTAEDFVFCAPGVPQNIGTTKEQRQRDQWWPNAKGAYGLLWNYINGSGAWEANPWVTAISFTVAKRNIDAEVRHG